MDWIGKVIQSFMLGYQAQIHKNDTGMALYVWEVGMPNYLLLSIIYAMHLWPRLDQISLIIYQEKIEMETTWKYLFSFSIRYPKVVWL